MTLYITTVSIMTQHNNTKCDTQHNGTRCSVGTTLSVIFAMSHFIGILDVALLNVVAP